MAEPGRRGHRPRVAITRSAADSRALAEGVERLGFEPIAVPLIEVVEPADGGRALVAALADLGRYRWVVVTSVNAVRSMVEAGDGRPWPDDVAVAAVGPTTASAARSAGLPVALVPEVATAAALVEAFPSADPGADRTSAPSDGHEPDRPRVLAPLADRAGDTVEAGLGAKGWSVERVEAYRTIAPSDDDHTGGRPGDGRVDAAVFFSPSAVDRWVDRFGPGGPPAVCIGPSTAARARQRGLGPVTMAEPHTEAGVLAALGALFSP